MKIKDYKGLIDNQYAILFLILLLIGSSLYFVIGATRINQSFCKVSSVFYTNYSSNCITHLNNEELDQKVYKIKDNIIKINGFYTLIHNIKEENNKNQFVVYKDNLISEIKDYEQNKNDIAIILKGDNVQMEHIINSVIKSSLVTKENIKDFKEGLKTTENTTIDEIH